MEVWEFCLNKLDTSLYRSSYKACFDTMNRLAVTREMDGQTDGQIDILI